VLFGPAQKAYADLPKEEVFPLWLLGVWVIGAGFIAAPFLSEIQRTTTPLMQAVLFQVLGVR
jgi:NADH:ubiquinone oxidoreductase subunit 4 (subunit M)